METLTKDTFGMQEALKQLGLKEVNEGTSTGNQWMEGSGQLIESHSPVDGALIGKVYSTTPEQYNASIEAAQKAFKTWRTMPAPEKR